MNNHLIKQINDLLNSIIDQYHSSKACSNKWAQEGNPVICAEFRGECVAYGYCIDKLKEIIKQYETT